MKSSKHSEHKAAAKQHAITPAGPFTVLARSRFGCKARATQILYRRQPTRDSKPGK